MTLTPYDFQVADVEALLAHGATGAIVAETGAGKTVIGAETARRSGAPTKLIIAPPGTHNTVWRHTIGLLDPEAPVSIINGTASGKAAMDDLEWKTPGYYLMSHQVFTRWKPLHLRPDLTLIDEVHYLGNSDGAGGKNLMKFAKSTGSRMVMSGTLYRNRFENGWTMMRFLYPERDGNGDIADISKNRWIDDRCATEYAHFAPGQRAVVGELHPGQLALDTPCWRQHFKRAECCEFHPEGFLADLPEPIVIREEVDLTPGQKKAMTQMQRDYLAYLDVATEEWMKLPDDEKKKTALVTKLPIVRETRLSQMTLAMPSVVPRPYVAAKPGKPEKHFMINEAGDVQAADENGFPLWDVVFAPDAESPKLDALVRIFNKLQEPMVAATQSQKFAELAVNRLNEMGIRAFEWSGAASHGERDEALAAFERGEYDIIVGVTAAIGTGIDGLQMASGVLVSMSKDRDLANEIQLEGRLDRRGQKRENGVIVYQIVAKGSTDEDVIDTQLERRLKLNRSLRRDIAKK